MRAGALTLALLTLAIVQADNDRPPIGPFTFVYGLERGGGLNVLRELGLNTLYIDLLPADLTDLQPCRTLIREAESQGYQVIVGLPTTEPLAGHVSPCDLNYQAAINELITHCVTQLRDEPGITAWGTGHSLERTLRYNDEDFRYYLQIGYPSLEALNASWGSTFSTWMQVTMAGARVVDENRPNTIGRASVDLADYQAWAYREVMTHWLTILRSLDTHRPILTGRITLYRSLVSVPEGYDIICVSAPPDVLEPDLYAHNVQALDIARRGGRFAVLQVLRCPHPSSDAYGANLFRDWIQMAALHGSVGIAVEDWDLLTEAYVAETRRSTDRWIMEALRRTGEMQFGVRPLAPLAVLYEPYAEGMQVTRQPTYGYLGGLLSGQPSNLAFNLRLGTAYGIADYLSLHDLQTAALDHYAVILAPTCLQLPPIAIKKLTQYIRTGGAVMADLGLGMYENNSWSILPEPLMEVFGLSEMGNIEARAGDLRVGTLVPELPSLQLGMATSRGEQNNRHGEYEVVTRSATERRGFSIIGLTAEARPAGGTIPVAPLAARLDADKNPLFRGLFANGYGAGLGLFATNTVWAQWELKDKMSQALHGDLLARRPRYQLIQTGWLQDGLHFSAEENVVLLLNRQSDPALAQLIAYKANSQAYSGAITHFAAAPTRSGLPPGAVCIEARVPGASITKLRRQPLIVQPRETSAAVAFTRYEAENVELTIAGAEAQVRVSHRRGLEIVSGAPVEIRLILRNGLYAVAPRSRHLVTVRWRGGQTKQTVTASSEGTLDLSATYRLNTIIIEPAP